MQHGLILSLLCGFAGMATTAFGAPLYLNKADAVAPPRRDAGTGVCGTVIKFINQPTPISTIDEAALLLNRSLGDPNLVGRVSRLFPSMNLSIGAGSEADFRPPTYPDDIFPYCTDANSMPRGLTDYNIAMRARGYLNVPDTASGQPVTLAVNCDDGCTLKLGTSKQLVTTADERSPQLTGRRARSVVFQDPGLYPIEIVYYQNATTGYLECSRANSMVFGGDDIAVSNVEWGQQATNFKPLAGAQLYSAVSGISSDCQECGGAVTDCGTGSYCGDGLCQACNVADHCGAACTACPMDKRLCSAGKCVQCTSDEMCSLGGRCDLANSMCQPPTPCIASSECKTPDVCRPEGVCGSPPTPCTAKSECQASQSCSCEDGGTSCSQKLCLQPPTPCSKDTDCPMSYLCDSKAQVCQVRYALYGGGFVACSMITNSHRSENGRGPLLILALALLGLSARMRRKRRSAASFLPGWNEAS